jgi:hypothetical protein
MIHAAQDINPTPQHRFVAGHNHKQLDSLGLASCIHITGPPKVALRDICVPVNKSFMIVLLL